MNPWLLFLTYIVCVFMGFCGGVIGYLFMERKKKPKKDEQSEVIYKNC